MLELLLILLVLAIVLPGFGLPAVFGQLIWVILVIMLIAYLLDVLRTRK